jgi:hypothetical protein
MGSRDWYAVADDAEFSTIRADPRLRPYLRWRESPTLSPCP